MYNSCEFHETPLDGVVSMELHGAFPWNSTENILILHEKYVEISMVFHGNWCANVFHGNLWRNFHGSPWKLMS